jgi:cytochrome c peroxidase
MNDQPNAFPPEPIETTNDAARASTWRRLAIAIGLAVLALIGMGGFFLAYPEHAPVILDRTIEDISGANPHPVKLVLPPVQPLSVLATIGQRIFNDRSLSASGRQSCASCHSADHAFGPPDGRSVQPGGPTMTFEGIRPPPSLAYLYRQDIFGIGPAGVENDNPPPLDQVAAQAQTVARSTKSAGSNTLASLVPRGGLFWDGREDTLMAQANGPLMNPAEMANTDKYDVARKLARGGYGKMLEPLFGSTMLNNPEMLFVEAMSALSRYQIESQAFHRFDSKYDLWLEGKARLSHAEMRGLRLFNDPNGANCAGCHLSQPSSDGLPPLFTDTEYEALGLPRNPAIQANRDPHFFDMGLCGPLRADLAKQTQYCGMFLTPTLRNTAKRGVYFHNGVYHTLKQVLDFYNLREVDPGRIYPRDRSGKILKYDDLPSRYHANIDVADAPFDRKFGDRRPLTDAEIADIIAFLGTLDDSSGPTRTRK